MKVISADIKTDVEQEIKKLVPVSYNLSQKSTFSKLVIGIPCSLILSIKNGEDGGGVGEGVFT